MRRWERRRTEPWVEAGVKPRVQFSWAKGSHSVEMDDDMVEVVVGDSV